MNYQSHDRCFSMDQFRAPDIDYAPVYSWVWNTRLTPETVCAQLDEFCTLGIRAIYVIPESKDFRPGFMDTDLDPDYLTPEFLQMFAYTLREAAARGMQMMLYDEDGWPSGAAGGRVVRGRPELCAAKLTPDGQIEPLGEPDRMNRTAVERFTALTHSAYAATDGIRPGQNIGVAFTDEPALPYPAWTPDLATEFPAQYGYDIREFAPALYDSDAMGEPGKRARIDYFDWTSRRFAESYFGTLRDWCRAHGMQSAGHANNEDCVQRAITVDSPHLLRMLRMLDIPGVDAIWRQIFPGRKPKPDELPFFPRLASSAAASTGAHRVLTESFACYGAGLTFDQMRYILLFQAVRGVNLFNFMNLSLGRDRQYMAGLRPVFSRLLPGAAHLPSFNAFTARLSYIASLGTPENPVALYLPMRSVWAGGAEAAHAAAEFIRVGVALEQRPTSFDIVDDDALAAAEIRDGRLVIGSGRYESLILPHGSADRMPDAVRAAIDGFAQAGISVQWLPDGAAPEAAPLVRTSGTALRALRRRCDNGTLLLVYNESTEPQQFPLDIDPRACCQLNPDTGDAEPAETAPTLCAGEPRIYWFPADGALPARSAVKSDGIPHRYNGTFTFRRVRAFRIDPDGLHDESIDEPFAPIALGDWRSVVGDGFSGDGVYRFAFDAVPGKAIRLDCGDVRYACRCTLNGRPVGERSGAPFRFDLPAEQVQTHNVVELTVSNTAANAYATTRVFDAYRIPQPGDWTAVTSGSPSVGPYHAKTLVFERDSLPGGWFGPLTMQTED